MDEISIDGAAIRRLRKNKGWSQMDLARLAWVDQGTISALERNAKSGLRMDTLVRLARTLGVPTDDLLVPTGGPPVNTADPQLDVMMRLVHDMSDEERRSAEMFIRFVMAHRHRREVAAKKQAKSDESPPGAPPKKKPAKEPKRKSKADRSRSE